MKLVKIEGVRVGQIWQLHNLIGLVKEIDKGSNNLLKIVLFQLFYPTEGGIETESVHNIITKHKLIGKLGITHEIKDNRLVEIPRDMFQIDDVVEFKELKGKKFETENLIAGHSQSDDKFNETIINLFVIANKLALAFKKSSKISQKREILKLVVRTLELDGSNLGFELNTPFNYMLNLAQCPDWRRV